MVPVGGHPMKQKDAAALPAPHNPLGRLVAVVAIGLFILGFGFPALAAFTAATGAAWLIGTQTPWRGFVLLAGFALVPKLLGHWKRQPLTGGEYLGWMLLGTVISVLPFLLHRLIGPRLKGAVSTLALPLWGTALQWMGQALLPAGVWSVFSLAETQKGDHLLLPVAAKLGTGALVFLVYWCGALINWMWDHDFRRKTIAAGAGAGGAIFVIAFGYGIGSRIGGHAIPVNLPPGSALAALSLVGGVGLWGWALSQQGKPRRKWADRPEVVGLLRSPRLGERLQVAVDQGRETLISPSGERFQIREGIPDFLQPEELTGSNRKYSRLYETIGGFYDSSQKFGLALMNINRDYLFQSVVRFLEITPGDRVLETSVGTGLFFPYLPEGVKRFGLDLSWAMLAACQRNLRRWGMEAELFHGNAEKLPYADESFDVVYHVGGINFFSDRAMAIREMIRVAKPGSRIVISDETEKHVKSSYERTPIASGYFRNRKEKVSPPIDLVPSEMMEIHLETIFEGRGYVLMFRKPD
jgi:ubiquinone/menaquinone biosynthesis C-methylase UbiE